MAKGVYWTFDNFSRARVLRALGGLPSIRVDRRVYDTLKLAINSLSQRAEYRRWCWVARYHDERTDRLMFILVAKV